MQLSTRLDTRLRPELEIRAISDVRGLLRQNDLSDDFMVKSPDNFPYEDWVALYRSGTAYRSRPIIWINKRLGKMLAERFEYLCQEDLDYDIHRNLVYTLLHECGHATADLIRFHFRCVDSPFKGKVFERDVCPDEEAFAETVFPEAVRSRAAKSSPWYPYLCLESEQS